jgi:UDP-glucose 4-epimerase
VTTKLALVTGATGAIGPTLVTHLLTNGYTVRTYSRQPPTPTLFPAGVESFQGDITDPEALGRAMRDVEVVFHLAALLHIENPPPDMETLYQTINVTGTQNVVTVSQQTGVRRLIYFSTVKVYGIQQDDPVDEATPPQPKTFYARTKWQAEQLVNEAGGLETVVLRLSAIYGPRLRGSWERMVKAIGKGWFLPIGDLHNRRSLTYVEDVGPAAQIAAEHAAVPGLIYNVVGNEAATMAAILTAIYGAYDKSVPGVHLPAFLPMLGVTALEKGVSLMGKRSPLTRDTLQQFISSEVYSGERLRQVGFTSTPLEEAWRKTIHDLNLPKTPAGA